MIQKELCMKRFLPIIAIVLIFVVGLGILCYPLISSVINNIGIRNEAKIENEKIENIGDDRIATLMKEAEDYNKSLLGKIILTDPFDEEAYASIGANYEESFNVNEDGLIGFVEIPKINVYLPIYHGTSTEVLSRGAGHLQNTAFPIGGPDTHCVISAHTAFPTETFFDYLTDMKEGDYFFMHVLNRVLTYQVDQIKVVDPDDTHDLYVQEGRDLVTLLTCTPYSINSHRLLVRGTRVADVDPEDITSVSGGDNYFFILGYKITYLMAAIVIIAFLAVVGGVVFLAIRLRKNKAAVSKTTGKGGDHGG